MVYGLDALSGWLRRRHEVVPANVRTWRAGPALAARVVLVLVFGDSGEAFIYFRS